MSDHGDFDEPSSRREYAPPYTSHHPIPTVQRYRAHKGELEEQQRGAEESQRDETNNSRIKRAVDSLKKIVKDDDVQKPAGEPYPSANLIAQDQESDTANQGRGKDDDENPPPPPAKDTSEPSTNGHSKRAGRRYSKNHPDDGQQQQSATEKAASHSDPRQKRKDMKHTNRDGSGREVTDPVTHLPIMIHDSTETDRKRVPENEPVYGTQPRTSTGFSGATKSQTILDGEREELQQEHDGMQKLFPPPNFEEARAELMRTYQFALAVGMGSILVLATLVLVVWQLLDLKRPRPQQQKGASRAQEEEPVRIFIPVSITVLLSTAFGGSLTWFIQGWLGKKVKEVWEDEVWEGARRQEEQLIVSNSQMPESVAWLNGLLASVWPLINPDLFTSISDMLEDVMQASLPKLVRMVAVDDLGQGSESMRILGIKWLPTGAASQTVDKDGNLEAGTDEHKSDRTAPGQGQVEDEADDSDNDSDKKKSASKEDQTQKKASEQEQEAIRQGMEAEQGDFVNMELAFAYRARSSGKSIKVKAKNAHLYLKFYLPGGVMIPVWVEMRGIVGIMRLRLQLTPDPPFFSLCTLTFVGQPRADLSCVPLSKHSLNLMDVPLLSSFVQTSIDAALAEYVAPKSLTLDLKNMLVGDDFKKDTTSRGVVRVYIKSARDFKEGDGGIGPVKGSSDAYVTVSWGKFGKPVASTRVIVDDQSPNWSEWAYILFGAEELNAQETLRLQLWDSDKYTADDDLGRVEVDLKQLMHSPKTKNRMCDREDRLSGEDPDDKMPGFLSWSVGCFSKTNITSEQLVHQSAEPEIKSRADLKRKVSETAHRKLREATAHDETKEIEQQKAQDYKEREDELLISSPPSAEFRSGILSIQIHNITGLELERLNKGHKNDGGDREDEAEEGSDLPSSFCTVILNHQKIYRTRTKPKNTKPFFNAVTERFIRDWRISEVMISVRDDRERENDALLGIVYLPLAKVFESRSQVMDSYPLAGGIGYGRVRLSMVFRSLELQIPKELLGWDYGTVEIKSPVQSRGGIGGGIGGYRIKLRSNLNRVKMQAQDGQWKPKHDQKSLFLAFKKRYSAPLIVEFRKSSIGTDSTAGFAVFWLKDIADEEEKTISMDIWKGSKQGLKKATTCCDYSGLGEDETPLGQIEVTMKFWRGLSGYHKSFANRGKNKDVRDVMEVLDTVNDEKVESGDEDDGSEDSESSGSSDDTAGNDTEGEEDEATKKRLKKSVKADTETDGSSTSSDIGADDGHGKDNGSGPVNKLKSLVDGHIDSEDGSRGVINQLKDYKDHHKQLHRKHRGIMQWKGARTASWMTDKMKEGKGKVGGIFHHGDRETGIETEV